MASLLAILRKEQVLLDRFSLLLLAATQLSDGGFILFTSDALAGVRNRRVIVVQNVTVHYARRPHTVYVEVKKGQPPWPAIVQALDRAVHWLTSQKSLERLEALL